MWVCGSRHGKRGYDAEVRILLQEHHVLIVKNGFYTFFVLTLLFFLYLNLASPKLIYIPK